MSWIESRIANRLVKLRKAGGDAIVALTALGVKAAIIGSTIHGRINTQSDLDILVLDEAGVDPLLILRTVESLTDLPVDLVFAKETDPRAVAIMMREASYGH